MSACVRCRSRRLPRFFFKVLSESREGGFPRRVKLYRSAVASSDGPEGRTGGDADHALKIQFCAYEERFSPVVSLLPRVTSALGRFGRELSTRASAAERPNGLVGNIPRGRRGDPRGPASSPREA